MDSLLQEMADIDATLALQRDWQKSLALIRALKAGTVSLDNVTMTDTGWTVAPIAPPEPSAEEPGEVPAEEQEESDDG